MRISEIVEAIDKNDANEVMRSLMATGDTRVAHYFQQQISNPIHTSIDSALRTAERMARREMSKTPEPVAKADIKSFKIDKEPPKDKAKDKPEPVQVDKDDSFDVAIKGTTSKVKPLDKFVKGYKLGSGFASKFLNR